ncbi:MAG: hypothetical protein RLZZ200_2987 [Pseudomonadota bacterium]|jgi:hypothetical protein
MNLGELLTELRENILHDRSDRIAGSPDLLWSDATLIRYIDQAHKRFARRSLIIRDGSTCEVTEVTLRTGIQDYQLHESVIAVLSAKYDGENGDLRKVGHTTFDMYNAPDPIYFDINAQNLATPGKPTSFSTDEQLADNGDGALSVVSMRVFPTPSADYNRSVLKLRVVRGVLQTFSSADLTMQPEIPEEHQLEMLDWAAYLALRIVDRDAGDLSRAEKFKADFVENVMQARQNAMRKLFAPQAWGFGRNGFTWEK